jgi:hypothetical protein
LHRKENERREPRLGDSDADSDLPEPAAATGASSAIAGEDLRRLQTVLNELSECRRLLDGVLR